MPLRHCKGNFDIGTRMKYVLIRRDLFRHLAGLFKHFESDIMAYSEVSWYFNFIGTEQDAEGTESPEEDASAYVEVSAYASKAPLMRLCTKLAKGHMELLLCKITMLGLHLFTLTAPFRFTHGTVIPAPLKRPFLRKDSVPGKSLNLSKDDSLQKHVDGCREKYMWLGHC